MLLTLAFDIFHVYCLFIASKHLFHIKSGNLPAGDIYTKDLLSTRVTTCLATVMDGMIITLPNAIDVRLCLMTNGHLCTFNQALYPVEHMTWCIYTLFINNKEQIEKNCLLKTINHTTDLAYSLDGYLWAISDLAAERLQIRCVMGAHIITMKPPLQIVDIGNGCEAYSTSIYIPAKSELTAMLQSIT